MHMIYARQQQKQIFQIITYYVRFSLNLIKKFIVLFFSLCYFQFFVILFTPQTTHGIPFAFCDVFSSHFMLFPCSVDILELYAAVAAKLVSAIRFERTECVRINVIYSAFNCSHPIRSSYPVLRSSNARTHIG